MKHDTYNTEQVYQCQGWPATDAHPAIPCGTHHQESTVAVREAIVDGHVSRTPFCDLCSSDDLRLFTESDAME